MGAPRPITGIIYNEQDGFLVLITVDFIINYVYPKTGVLNKKNILLNFTLNYPEYGIGALYYPSY